MAETEKSAEDSITLELLTPDESPKGQLNRIQVALEEGRLDEAVTMLEAFSQTYPMPFHIQEDYLDMVEYTSQTVSLASREDLVGRLYDMAENNTQELSVNVLSRVMDGMDQEVAPKVMSPVIVSEICVDPDVPDPIIAPVSQGLSFR